MGWLQFNLSLARRGEDALPAARCVFGSLGPLLREWKSSGVLRRFFFVRKPPDIRLRFETEAETSLLPQLQSLFGSLHDEGAISLFVRSVYEPEQALFGGPNSMDLVHSHFEADTLGWMELDRLAAEARRTLGPPLITSAVLNDLFLKTLADANEIWDVWHNLRRLVDADSAPQGWPEQFHVIDSLLWRGPPREEVEILRKYEAANRDLALGLQRVWGEGQLECGMRGLLAFVALFLFNRHGLGGPEKSAVISAMDRLCHPMRALTGGYA